MYNLITECRAHYEASARILDAIPKEASFTATPHQRKQVYEAARFAKFILHVLSPLPRKQQK